MPTWWYLWDEIREKTEDILNRLSRGRFYFGWYNSFLDSDHAHTLPKGESHLIDFDGECYCKPDLEPIAREDGSYGWLYRHRAGTTAI